MKNAQKLRVWWIPQVGAGIPTYHKEVGTIEEGKLLMDTLAEYDAYQLEHNIKPDYCNVGGLQALDAENGEWEDWDAVIDGNWFDDVDEYLEFIKERAEDEKVNELC